MRTLLAFKRGEPRVCAMARPPTLAEEDRRRILRERAVLLGERIRHTNRIKGLLFSQGIADYEPLKANRRAALARLRTGDGRQLGEHMLAQIARELDRLEMVLVQIKAVEAERDALVAHEQGPAQLACLKGLGEQLAVVLWSEGLYRRFDDRRQVAAYCG